MNVITKVFYIVVNVSSFFFWFQVHNRSEYLHHLVNSLRSAHDIGQTLLILSHDVYSSELNSIVASIDFCPVSRSICANVVLFLRYHLSHVSHSVVFCSAVLKIALFDF